MNREMQVKKGFPTATDACLPKPQANSLTQGQRKSSHPGSEEDAKARNPTVAEHSTVTLPEGLQEDIQLPSKTSQEPLSYKSLHRTYLSCLVSSLRSPPPHSLPYLDLSGSTAGSSPARRAEFPACRCRRSGLQEGVRLAGRVAL